MDLMLASFRFDVTPDIGDPLCGGWIPPAQAIDDPLEAIGLILFGPMDPIVLCTFDWCGLCNRSYERWRQALAEAAHTVPNRVLLHCVHQHDAPFICERAHEISREFLPKSPMLNTAWFERMIARGKEAAQKGMSRAERVTSWSVGQAKVEQVASNRRFIGKDGKLEIWRASSSKDAKIKALPVGLIDPYLKSITFENKGKPLGTLSFYACHPMSHYGQGRVSSDFVGLARKRRQKDDPNVTQLYWTGCAGNVAAGKFNAGTPEDRRALTDRMYQAMATAFANRTTVDDELSVAIKQDPARLKPRKTPSAEDLSKTLKNAKEMLSNRLRSAFELSFKERDETIDPWVVSAVHLGKKAALLHLPGECFVEYQLRAQSHRAGGWVFSASYGDGGPWYLPTRSAYPEGGYEVSVAFAGPETPDALQMSIDRVLGM